MSETHWDEINKLEEIIQNGNSSPVISFMNKLAQAGLLDCPHILTTICSALPQHPEVWSILHEFAHQWFSVPEDCKNGSCNCDFH